METAQIETPHGPARVHLDEPLEAARLLLVLGHGAGGGVAAPDLLVLRDSAVAVGAVVARVEQPYRVAGRRAPAPAGQLDEAWRAVVEVLRGRYAGLPLVAGGRSSGARVACRSARATAAVAVVALAFPLRPPWHPERSRAPELLAPGMPVLVVNGDRDPFGVPEGSGLVVVVVVPGADHALRGLPRKVADEIAGWITVNVTGGKQYGDSGVAKVSPVRPEDP